jgi:hypothetical protein
MIRRMTMMMAALTMVLSTAAFAALSPHTTAVLDGTMHKTDDGKGYVIKVESAKTMDGKDMPELKGKEMPIACEMSGDMSAACMKHCEKAVQVTCCIEDGKIVAVSNVTGRDMTKPGTKGAN